MRTRKKHSTGDSKLTTGVPDPSGRVRGPDSMAATQRLVDRKYREWLKRRGLRDEGRFTASGNNQLFS